MTNNNLPQLTTVQYVSLSSLSNYFDKKYHQNYLYDRFNSASHFYQWCDLMKYGVRDSDGRERGSSELWYTEYQKHAEGKVKCPPRKNFISEVFDSGVDRFFYLEKEECDHKEQWIKDILLEIYKVCHRHFADGVVTINIME